MADAETTAIRIETGATGLSRLLRTYRLHVQGPTGGSEARFSQPNVRIGTHPGNDLVLDDPAVSRLHLEIEADEHGFRIRDLGSRNGTWVEGLRAADVHLRRRGEIRVGATTIVLEPLAQEVALPLSAQDRFGPLLGTSVAMREIFATLRRVAPSRTTLLVEGESGTGKEGVAEALHQASGRAGPLVVLDCGAIAPTLIESELFGHERGAFTGAVATRDGCFAEADGGTLFLDEIGELPRDLQPKLLRAIEKREIRRIGAARPTAVDVRIVAATNRDLAREVNRGAFREDLFYRLAVVRILLPPLRERTDDLRPLVEHFARSVHGEELGEAAGLEAAQGWIAAIDPAGWEQLEQHHWPGNVRELRNAVERSITLGTPGRIDIGASASPLRTALPPPPAVPASGRLAGAPDAEACPPLDLDRPYAEMRDAILAWFESVYAHGLLDRHGQRIARAAAAAGLDRTHFKRILRRRTAPRA